jgi:phosphopantetheine--protein transferase-like protein
MSETPPQTARCGIDTVEITRVEKLIAGLSANELRKIFTDRELEDAGQGAGRAESLAARFAAKEACCKLFPRETSLGVIEPSDFGVRRDAYGAPQIEASSKAQAVIDRYRIAAILISLTHTETSASAVAMAELKKTDVPWFGKWLYHLLPYRRALVLENMRRVFGDVLPEEEIRRMAQGYYAHYARFLKESLVMPFISARRREDYVRVENVESPVRAHEKGRGVLLLTGHFGNWEASTTAAIKSFPQYKNLFYFVRRPIKPDWLNKLIAYRDRRNGFGTLSKTGSLDTMLDLLAKGAIIIFVYDQHAGQRDGVVVDFLGHPAGTFKSLALIALSTGAPVVPAASWREADGTHVLRFEDPIPLIESENVDEAIRKNTQAFNDALGRMLLRHPEQWIWMHKRWKPVRRARVKKHPRGE